MMQYFKKENFLLGLFSQNSPLTSFYKLRLVDLDSSFFFGAFEDKEMARAKLFPKAFKSAKSYVGQNTFNERNSLLIADPVLNITSVKENS